LEDTIIHSEKALTESLTESERRLSRGEPRLGPFRG
jgi:hypothetical protein